MYIMVSYFLYGMVYRYSIVNNNNKKKKNNNNDTTTTTTTTNNNDIITPQLNFFCISQ